MGFLRAVSSFAKEVRSQRLMTKKLGFPGGINEDHAYHLKSFTRGMGLAAERLDDTIFDVTLSLLAQLF